MEMEGAMPGTNSRQSAPTSGPNCLCATGIPSEIENAAGGRCGWPGEGIWCEATTPPRLNDRDGGGGRQGGGDYPDALRNQHAPGGRCRRSGEGIPEVVSTLGVFIIPRIVRHNLLRMLEPADQTAVARHVGRAQSLGFERPGKIRELIARHRNNLSKINILPTDGISNNRPGRQWASPPASQLEQTSLKDRYAAGRTRRLART